MRTVVALVCTFAFVLVSSPSASPGAATKVERRAALETAVVREMNKVRAERGLRPLRSAPSLRTAARTHSRAMLDHGFFGHDSVDGTDFSRRIGRFYTNRGWSTWSVGEALLAGRSSTVDPAEIVRAWLNSPSHRDIVLSPTWRDAGVGVLYAPIAPREYGNAEAVVVTADFGLREGRAEAP